MRLWVGGSVFEGNDFKELRHFSGQRPDLEPLISFLDFWYSDQESFTLLTSGSTGTPKPIVLHRRAMLASAARTNAYFHWDTSAGDAWLLCISSRFVGGLMVLVRAWLTGADVWLEAPSTQPLFSTISHIPDKKWMLSLAPLQIDFLATQPGIPEKSASWKGVLVGGGPLSETQRDLADRFSCPVFHSYGMTETYSHIALARINGFQSLRPGFFQPLPGIQLRTDEENNLEICADITGNQWLKTKDRVQLFENGNFLVLGRSDRVINSGGLKIDPSAIKQQIIQQFPVGKAQFEILGMEDNQLGQRLVLVYEKYSSVNQELWMEIVSKFVPETHPQLRPRQCIGLERFPLLANLKIDFTRLQKMAEEKNESS